MLPFPNFTVMLRLLACTALLFVLLGCKGKKKKTSVPSEQFFPVSAYLKGEISRLDKSLHSFYKVETDSGRTDTVPIPNTEAKRLAADFYNLPDIGSEDLKDNYEVTHTYDDALNAFVFMFTTKEDLPVQREDVVLDPEPDAKGNYKILSIFAEVWKNNGDTTIRKNMLWNAGKSYQITTLTEAGGTEKTEKLQVFWNGFDGTNR